ncbi:MAG: penicillin-binding protein [Panacagrimonas sp.]|nr:penicillin-binding protein [Panacagrimonas sp.]
MPKASIVSRPLIISLSLLGGLLALAAAAPFILFYGARWYYEPTLPPVATLRELKLGIPLRVYSHDGKLIGEYGAERRAPLAYDQLPPHLVDAFLAAEDDRFFEHPGVDWQGLLRASLKLLITGEKSQGGSTITMQLARNVFLSSERSYERKIREILLALRIEREMSKQEILTTYLNAIFLGQRAYGVGAASRVYFAREPADLSWSQTALLAGLPKAPSRDNPVIAPQRAKDRRDYVLRRLRELNKISELDYQAALAEPILVKLAPPQVETDAHFVAEMVRADMVSRYGEAAYTSGFKATATVQSTRQEAANVALRAALLAYDERHGWRGPEARLPPELLTEGGEQREAIEEILSQRPIVSGLRAAAVVRSSPDKLTVLMQGLRLAEVAADDLKWARIGPRNALQRGDIVRVRSVEDRWRLAQIPEVQGALAAVDPRSGAIQAVVGGYDFLLNKYNRATQARRQPGSGFKPFLYAAAFDQGFTPASVLLDAPIVYRDSELEGAWRPENYDGDFKGPMRLREALVHSRNLVTIRLLQAVGLDTARNYIARFGLSKDRIPRDLSMALGTGSYSPMEMATAYAVLANGGFQVKPYVIESIADSTGKVVYQAAPTVVCAECEQPEPQKLAAAPAQGAVLDVEPSDPAAPAHAPRVIDARVAWLVDDVLREVTVRGTAAQARKLGRSDIAGKTGTTNDETDAWFSGYNGELVSVVWVGFDQPSPLGRGEVGGRAALPMWMDFMRAALGDSPEVERPRPPGLVEVRIDRTSGMLAAGGDPNAIIEIVQDDHIPGAGDESGYGDAVPLEELF